MHSSTAHSLVEADLRGVESHGLVRLAIYAERLRRGAIASRPHITVVRQSSATAVVDGGNGMGQVVGAYAMRLAIEKGRAGEPAFVSVRNSNHFGAAAYFAEMAVAEDMIGVAYTIGGINHMTPWGGAEAILGNNPFAVAFPVRNAPPVVLDMACSVAARGKIIVAAKENVPIPADWAVDRDGVPTTDAKAALEGFVSPVGGPKGYALTLAIGLLSTMLSGAGFGSEVTHMYEDFERPQNIGHLVRGAPHRNLRVAFRLLRPHGEGCRRDSRRAHVARRCTDLPARRARGHHPRRAARARRPHPARDRGRAHRCGPTLRRCDAFRAAWGDARMSACATPAWARVNDPNSHARS